MKSFIVKAENKRLIFHSDTHRAMFADFLTYCEKENKKIKIEIAKNPVSDQLRGYYYAAVLPFVRNLCEAWHNLTDEEMHNVLKKQFYFFETYNAVTKRKERFARSVMSSESNTQQASEFIEIIGRWVSENYGQNLPDPEQYKRFRDSAPLKGE